jgi:hypothetical protein
MANDNDNLLLQTILSQASLTYNKLEKMSSEMVTKNDYERFQDSLEKKFTGIDEQFNGVDQQFKVIDNQFKITETKFNDQFENADERFKVQDDKFNKLEPIKTLAQNWRGAWLWFIRVAIIALFTSGASWWFSEHARVVTAPLSNYNITSPHTNNGKP